MNTLADHVGRLLSAHNPGEHAIEPRLASALGEAVNHPGRRMRAGLILQAAARHGLPAAAADQLACALEYWHQASLILDDLPCMDDAVSRRGRPALHRAHGEATAILAALALINRAYSLVQSAFVAESALVRQAALELVDETLGAAGMLGGQARDLGYAGGRRLPAEVGRIAWRKTGVLLWLALSLPLLPSGAWHRERRHLRALAVYWSLIYQGTDDLLDVSLTGPATGKTGGRDAALGRPNLTIALGTAVACRRIERLLDLAQRRLTALAARDGKWGYLADWHEQLFVARFRLFAAA